MFRAWFVEFTVPRPARLATSAILMEFEITVELLERSILMKVPHMCFGKLFIRY